MKFTAKAFVSAAYNPRQIAERLRDGDADQLNQLAFWSYETMPGWTPFGTATIELEIDEKHAIEAAVAQLRDKMDSDRAAFVRSQKQMLDQINSMLAIGFEEKAE